MTHRVGNRRPAILPSGSRSSSHGKAILTLIVAIAAGCESATAPPEPARVVVTSGAGQTGTAGDSLPQPVVVRVEDANGNGLGSFTVLWQVTGGNGTLSAASSKTAPDGTARVTWILGTAAGANSGTATVNGLSPATFTATASAGPPAATAVHAGNAQTATVASSVATQPALRVADRHGNPVAGERVSFAVASGGGSLTGESATTDAAGVATVGSWTLGPAAGANTLTARVADLAAVAFTATGTAGAPARLEITAGDGQAATVTTAVPVAPAVLVQDAHGNPVENAAVRFAVTGGGGSVAGQDATTNTAGVATVGSWTLGATAGANTLSGSVAGLVAVAFTATGTAGDPAWLDITAGDGQEAAVNTPVAIPPAVLVQDAHGNPVENAAVSFAVTGGGGSITGGDATTGADGVAAVGSWTMGAGAGPNTLSGTVSGVAPITFQAQASSSTLNLYVEAVHLNQGSQSLHGTIGGVAQRAGLLRVVVRASEANFLAPDVRVRLYEGGTLLREEVLPAAQSGVAVDPDLRRMSDTWNLPLAAADVVPGLAVEVLVDPAGAITETTKGDNGFPASGGAASLDVRSIYPFNIVFIPIEATVHGLTGNVNAGNTDQFLAAPRKWIASSVMSPTMHATFTTNQDLSLGSGWSTLLSDIQAMRTAEGAVDQYYHGIVPRFNDMAYGGLAYRPSSASSTYRSGLTYDGIPGASATLAHELGHNLGRRHAPCGNPAGQDTEYPHSDAQIGPPGFDIVTNDLLTAAELRDYMSYCGPRWTSDYTFQGILEWRRGDPYGQSALRAAAPTGRGLLLWGRVHSDGVTLNPAFVLEGAPVLPEETGPNVLRGVAADGGEVFRMAFAGVPVADGDDPEERHFSFFLPLADAEIEALDRIELAAPRGTAVQVSTGAASSRVEAPGGPADEMKVRLDPLAGGRARLRWDAARYPMALVRDPATGQVLAFLRGGDARLAAGGLDLERLQVLVSDGARSRPAKPE